jgi:predicted DNA-binding transcriptional regulator AlpA
MDIPELLTVPDFLDTYRISRTEFYRQLRQPESPLRLTKLGRASRIARADAEAWAASLPIHKGAAS